jgi:hypothetical protein
MKCPKCGYTSFESYDTCRKCSADLLEFKQTHGLTALVLPPSLRASMVADLKQEINDNDSPAETGGDMFSFELPTEQKSPETSSDPFSFDDAPAVATPIFSFDTPPVPAQDDPFASLLEAAPQQKSKEVGNQSSAEQGIELNNFSWDDTPTPGQPGSTPAAPAKSADDDFNSLFGDLGDSGKK